MRVTNEVQPAVAVIAFAAWLSTRKQSITIGSTHDAARLAFLAGEFIKSQGFEEPAEGWDKELKPYPDC